MLSYVMSHFVLLFLHAPHDAVAVPVPERLRAIARIYFHLFNPVYAAPAVVLGLLFGVLPEGTEWFVHII